MTAPDLSILTSLAPAQPEDPAARTARHLGMLAELAELGMQLARATAARALADLAQPEAPEAQEQQSEAPLQTEAAAPPPEPAQATTPRRTAPNTPGTTPRKPTDPVQNFIRLAEAVCRIIALEAGLATSPAAATRRGLPSPALRADPRRETLIKAFREVTEQSTNRAALRAELTYQLDAALTDDPEQILSLPEIFFPLCRDYEIEPDPAKLSDEILGIDPIDYANDPYCMNPPPPRATSPP